MTRIIWFRNDLRVSDHPALSLAASAAGGGAGAAVAGADRLIPVFIFPPRLFSSTSFGFPKLGPHRARFLLETLEDLKRALQARGSDLLILQGRADRIIPALAEYYGAAEIRYPDEAGTEEATEVAELESALQGRSACAGQHPEEHGRPAPPRLIPHYSQTLYHPEDLPFAVDDMPLVYTDFRKAVEKHSELRPTFTTPEQLPPLPATPLEIEGRLRDLAEVSPELPGVKELSGSPAPEPDPRAAIRFTGGESAGRERLNAYFWERDLLRRYKYTRNGLLGADYSSKFSPWLANGSLSPRIVVEEVRRYEAQRVKNSSSYWLVFELIWRDYFAYLLRTFGPAMFRFEGPMNRHYPWRNDDERFTAWKEGRTGQDFIDANMREIAATGYMSNRGRQNVASYLARDMQVNWLMGAEYFESQLIDYDPGSNYGNWTYTVGVGTDPRRDRYFNPQTQAQKYDVDARYRRHWLDPEDA